MHSDEETLYDPDEQEVTRSANATEISNNTNNNTSNVYGEPTVSIAAPIEKRWLILEIPVFLVFLARYMSSAVFQNQVLYQTCLAVFHYNQTECEPLLGISRESEDAQRIESEVQPYVARIFMARSLLESIIPAFVSLFIGPWSDKFGRRPILLSIFGGYFIGFVILSILVFISARVIVSPWWLLLSSVPSVLSGGTCALITGIYCYISDVAKERSRALRMVLNEAALCAGMMIGSMAGGYLCAATDVLTVFIVSTVFLLVSLLYLYFFVPESLKPEQIHSGSRIREFFRFELVKDLVRTCFERRPNFDRAIIWLTMLALTVAIFIMEGDSNVTYLFLRKKFEWTLEEYSVFNSIRIIVQIVGSIIGMLILRKIFQFSIITMTLIAMASSVLESTVRATAMFWWEMYLGMVLGSMRGILGPMSRAILSHVAPPTEVGKIYALTTSLECVSPLGAAPLYTMVYDATLNFYPGLFNFISAGLYLLCFTMIAAIYGIQKSLSNTSIYQTIGS